MLRTIGRFGAAAKRRVLALVGVLTTEADDTLTTEAGDTLILG